MKKSVILGILGLAAVAATSSYGQGYILLSNYASGTGTLTYGANVPANGVSGAVGSGPLSTAWTVGLYFTAGTPAITDPAGTGIPLAPLALGTGTGSSIAIGAGNANGQPGYYASIPFFNAGVAAGSTITAEMITFPTSAGSYASALYRGHSSPFTIVTVPVTSTAPNITGLANGLAASGSILVGAVAPVPEPTTLALAGLGGLASLVALRRKQT